MSRNEAQTCHDVIEPALRDAGWASQRLIADYLLRLHVAAGEL